jgi:hypothetical protein
MKVQAADTGPTQAAKGTSSNVQGRAGTTGGPGPVDRTDLSRLGALLEELQALQRRDPARYERALVSLSSRLDEAAAARPGGADELLTALARKLRGAAPPQGGSPAVAVTYGRAGAVESSALEDLVEASLRESAG